LRLHDGEQACHRREERGLAHRLELLAVLAVDAGGAVEVARQP
jgi:hypothetical protein